MFDAGVDLVEMVTMDCDPNELYDAIDDRGLNPVDLMAAAMNGDDFAFDVLSTICESLKRPECQGSCCK